MDLLLHINPKKTLKNVHTKTGPLDNWTQIYHLNTRLVRYSDGYCICFGFWKISLFIYYGNQFGDFHQNVDAFLSEHLVTLWKSGAKM